MLGACLYRRPSGIYAIRVRVPDRLRPVLGKGEIHISTGLREPSTAKLAALKIQHELRRRLMTLDLDRIATPSPLLAGDGLLPVIEAAKAIGMSADTLLGELRNERADLFTQAQHWHGLSVANIYDIDRDYDGTFILNDVEDQGIPQTLAGIVRAYDSAAVVSALLAEGKARESIFRLSESGNGAFWPDEPVEVPMSAWMASKKAVERIRSGLVIHLPPSPKKAPVAPSTPPEPAAPTPTPVGPQKHAGMRFSELFDQYRKHRNWGEDQTRRMTTEAGLFIELMDDPALGDIDLKTVTEFVDKLKQLPSDIYLSRRRFKVQSLQELAQIAAKKGLALKNGTTISGHVGRIAEILNFAKDKGMLHANPASGYKREWGMGKKVRTQDKRETFTPDELKKIFSQDWFVTGAGAFTQSGITNWRPHCYWLPLLALTTGARLNELAQLYLDDVRQSESGTWLLDFNLDQPDKIDGDDKSLKTVNAERIVPLHDAVIAAGLPEYVAALRKAGHVRLFPELKRDAVKGYGKPAGSWFNERFLGHQLGMVRDGKKTFHSFRHTFITALERLDLQERVMAQIAGHERGKTQSGSRYAKDRSADELKPIIDRLKFECLAGVGHFDAEAGLKAVKYAQRLKRD